MLGTFGTYVAAHQAEGMPSSSNEDDMLSNYHVVKCVAVGDTAVGKTKLICAGVLGSPVPMDQILASHVPTVWAVDHYRNRKDIMRRSMMTVDGVNVSLQLWDTFGDHEKDRKYAYQRSNVVLLCFSVTSPKSYQHVITKWYPEIRRYCPNTPILLVGCKNDLRYIKNDSSFLQYLKESSPYMKKFPEKNLISRDQGRELATEIGACYYETSSFSLYGVECVFENLVRLALIARRSQKFWLKKLRNVGPPILQSPYCPAKPTKPALYPAPPSTFRRDIGNLMRDDYGPDLALAVDKYLFYVHRLVLASTSYFKHLFTMPELKDINMLDLPSFRRMDLDAGVKSLAYQYTGELEMVSSEILLNYNDIATVTDVEQLREMVCSKSNGELTNRKAGIYDSYISKLQDGLREMGLDKKLFVDIAFEVEDGMCYAHRAILLARCDVMKTMFSENFIERSLEIILFPDTTKEAFDICLQYLYTDGIEGSVTIENCLDVIVLANRLCIFRLITLVEIQIIQELNAMIENNKYISDIVLLLLEPCELHNSFQLFDFCQYYILSNYHEISIFSADLLESLTEESQAHLKKFRWPPAEVHREQLLYEKLVCERERAAKRARRFAFWKTAKKTASGWFRFAVREGGPRNAAEGPQNAAEDPENAAVDAVNTAEDVGNAAEGPGNYENEWEIAV